MPRTGSSYNTGEFYSVVQHYIVNVNAGLTNDPYYGPPHFEDTETGDDHDMTLFEYAGNKYDQNNGNGYYASSTSSNESSFYMLNFNTYQIFPWNSSAKYEGRSVRCMAR